MFFLKQKSYPVKLYKEFFISPLYKDIIEKHLLDPFLGETKLHEAIRYALSSPGKRIRPLIVFLVKEALQSDLNVIPAALCCEYFHTASLIADDLPCMDNDDFRRDRPTLHKIFGETTALLASYALISESFQMIYQNGKEMQKQSQDAEKATMIALECASRCSGIRGASLGQFKDLFCAHKSSLKEIEEIIYLKTGTLFEGSFVLGWVFSGGDLSKIKQVQETAQHFGNVFQLRDDLLDVDCDKKRKNPCNLALLYGEEKAQELLGLELEQFSEKAQNLFEKSFIFQPLLEELLVFV